MDSEFTIVCWTCGGKRGVIGQHPQFAFELAFIADMVGWVGVIDAPHHRSLVFCNKACLERAKTRKGTMRLRPPKTVPPKEQRE
jgi:hypothetical protein